MRKYNVYPKEGEKFPVEFERFKVKKDHFVLYDDSDKESTEGYLSFANVAAIIPDQQGEQGAVCFEVYLKGQPKPAKVFARHLEIEPDIAFKWTKSDPEPFHILHCALGGGGYYSLRWFNHRTTVSLVKGCDLFNPGETLSSRETGCIV